MSDMPNAENRNYLLADEPATLALGAEIARILAPGVCVHLSGDLGAGKTTLSRGILHGLGFKGRVKSPTYTLVELYVISTLNLYHFDFYRFNDPEEWNDAGFRDLFNGTNISLVEWPEKAGERLPPPDLRIALSTTGDMGRNALIEAHTARGKILLNRLPTQLPA